MTSPASLPSRWLAYARLLRIPNIFTAFADIAMGYFFVEPSLEPLYAFLALVAASGCIYSAGMVLNDVFDVEVDRRERPRRPLPSEQIDVRWARRLGFGLLGMGVAAAWLAGLVFANEAAALPWRSGAIATILAVCVLLYDAVLKKTPLGPLAMGSCRFFNVLMGMGLATRLPESPTAFLSYDAAQLLVAAGIATYIVGVTWFARSEATESRRPHLILAVIVMALGFVLLFYFPQYGEHKLRLRKNADFMWPVMLLFLAASIFRRMLSAVTSPKPELVQAAIKHAILSLIVLDAAVTLVVRGQYEALGVVALVAPMFFLGRWVYST